MLEFIINKANTKLKRILTMSLLKVYQGLDASEQI